MMLKLIPQVFSTLLLESKSFKCLANSSCQTIKCVDLYRLHNALTILVTNKNFGITSILWPYFMRFLMQLNFVSFQSYDKNWLLSRYRIAYL